MTRPGAVGAVVPGGKVRQCLGLEIADDELDLGVLAVLSVDVVHRLGAVGDECVVAPVGEQLGLIFLGVQVHAADDQALIAERRFGQFADAGVGVVSDGLPGLIGDQRDLRRDDLVHRHADRELTTLLAQARDDLLVPESRVGPQQDRAGRAGTPDAGEQFVDETQRAALRVRLPFSETDVQHLGAVGARGEDRVVPGTWSMTRDDDYATGCL